jgi:hypothetical protein
MVVQEQVTTNKLKNKISVFDHDLCIFECNKNICNTEFQSGHFSLLSGRRDKELNIGDSPDVSENMATIHPFS